MKTNKTITSFRQQIDQIDEQISILCKQRLITSEKLIRLKSKTASPVVDRKREKEILATFHRHLKRKTSAQRLKNFTKALLKLNLLYPK